MYSSPLQLCSFDQKPVLIRSYLKKSTFSCLLTTVPRISVATVELWKFITNFMVTKLSKLRLSTKVKDPSIISCYNLHLNHNLNRSYSCENIRQSHTKLHINSWVWVFIIDWFYAIYHIQSLPYSIQTIKNESVRLLKLILQVSIFSPSPPSWTRSTPISNPF